MDKVEKYYQILGVLQELEKFSIYQFGSEENVPTGFSNNFDLMFLEKQIFEKKISEYKITCNFENTILADQMIAYVHNWLLMNTLKNNAKTADCTHKYMIDKYISKKDN